MTKIHTTPYRADVPEGEAISRAIALEIKDPKGRVILCIGADGTVSVDNTRPADEVAAEAWGIFRDHFRNLLRSLPPQDGDPDWKALTKAGYATADHWMKRYHDAAHRAEKAEAERDAISAAAFEAAEAWALKHFSGKMHETYIAGTLLALTPADAKAALDAMIEAAVMTECAAFSAGYEAGERGDQPAALTAQPVAQSDDAIAASLFKEAAAQHIERRSGSIPFRQEIAKEIRALDVQTVSRGLVGFDTQSQFHSDQRGGPMAGVYDQATLTAQPVAQSDDAEVSK